MADNGKTKIDIETELNAKDNASKVFDKNTESIKKNTEALEKNAKAREKVNSKGTATTSAKASKLAQQEEQVEQQILQDKKKTQNSGRLTMSRAEAISTMTEEQLQVYQYLLKTERKQVNQSARRLRNTEKNIALEEQAEERKRKNQERLNKQTEAYTNYMEARTSKVAAQEQNITRRRSGKYQLGRGFISAGSYLGKNLPSPSGNIVSTGMQMVGAGLANPAAAASIAVTQLTRAITQFAKSATQSYAEIESIRTQLGVVYGNQTQANDAFSQLSAYAVKSPFGVQQISELATLLKQSGVEASNLMDTLTMLGDTAGGNMEKMKRIANNYAQIVSIGKASMLDMRQFAYAGIPIFEKVAEELQVSQSQLRKMISDGKVTSEVIEDVFKKMTSAGGLFYEATSKGAETLKARLTNLKDIKQLALGGVGEGMLRLGETYGGDSFAYKGLSLAEDFYNKINKISTLQNLEKSVKTIEANKSEKENIQNAIDYYKSVNGLTDKQAQKDPVIQNLLKELAELNSQFNPDKERNSKASLYEVYRGNSAGMSKVAAQKIVDNNLATMQDFANRYDLANRSYQLQYDNIMKSPHLDSSSRKKALEQIESTRKKQNETIQAEQEAYEERLKQAYKALEYYKNNKITPDLEDSWQEKQIILGQQESYDQAHEARGRSTSVENVLAEIETAREKSDEYKEKEQAEQRTRWEKVINLVSEIKKAEDKQGNLDLSKLTSQQFLNILNAGGLVGRKLAVTYEDDADAALKDMPVVESQFITMVNKIAQNMTNNESGQSLDDGASPINKAVKSLDKSSTSNFYHSYRESYDSIRAYLSQRMNDALNDDVKAFWEVQIQLLESSTNEWALAGAATLDDLNLLDSTKKEFIPLWKRLIANATGISSTAITDKNTALSSYRDDMAVRNNTRGIVGTYLSTGGILKNILSTLVPSGEAKRLKEAGYDAYQLDWSEIKKNLKDFSLSLKASTNVIDSYKSGLESQLNTYVALAQALVDPESQDLKEQKTVTQKKLTEVSKSEGEQLVTAFGDKLVTADGLKVDVSEGANGEAVFSYKNGEEIVQLTKDQVYISDDLIKFLEKEIPEIRKDIKEAGIAQAKNKVLAGLLGTGQLSTLQVLGLNKNTNSSMNSYLSKFYTDNSEEFLQLFSNNLDLGNYENESSLYTDYLKGNADAVNRVHNAINEANNVIMQLMGSEEFKALKKNVDANAKRESVLKDYGIIESWGTPEGMTTEEKRGQARNILNTFIGEDVLKAAGLSGDNDIEDLTEQFGKLSEEELKAQIAGKAISNTFEEMNTNLEKLVKNTASDMFLAPFKTLGEDMIDLFATTKDWSDLWDDVKSNMKAVAGEMLSNIGTELATCGIRIASAAALEGNWGLVAGGLGLAAAGGVASGLGSMLSSSQKNNDDDETAKLETLADELADLLEQARTDALYYENNLRHKTALGINKSYSNKSVNDAIIAPNGNVITTAPDDYLIATKTPQSLGGGNTVVQPKINFVVNNNSSAKVDVQQQQNSDGTIEFVAQIYDAMDNYIASSRSDDAFTARQYRINGRQTIR